MAEQYWEHRLGVIHPPRDPEDRPRVGPNADPFVTGWHAALAAVRADVRAFYSEPVEQRWERITFCGLCGGECRHAQRGARTTEGNEHG